MLEPSRFARWTLSVPESIQYRLPRSVSAATAAGVLSPIVMISSMLEPSRCARWTLSVLESVQYILPASGSTAIPFGVLSPVVDEVFDIRTVEVCALDFIRAGVCPVHINSRSRFISHQGCQRLVPTQTPGTINPRHRTLKNKKPYKARPDWQFSCVLSN